MAVHKITPHPLHENRESVAASLMSLPNDIISMG